MWDQLTIGYLAGLVDGEGSIELAGKKKSQQVKVTVTSTDLDIVERAFNMSEIGNIQGPYQNKDRRKDGSLRKQRWYWAVTNKSDVARLLCAIAPILSEKRREEILPVVNYIYDNIPRPKNCTVCGTGFIPKDGSQLKRIYCSQKCNSKAYALREIAKRQVDKTAKEIGSFSDP